MSKVWTQLDMTNIAHPICISGDIAKKNEHATDIWH